MIHFFFFELGGGDVSSMAFTASSNFSGASVSRSLFRGFSSLSFFTNPFPAPSGQRRVLPDQEGDFTRQSIPSNTLPVSQALSGNVIHEDFHPFAALFGRSQVQEVIRKAVGL